MLPGVTLPSPQLIVATKLPTGAFGLASLNSTTPPEKAAPWKVLNALLLAAGVSAAPATTALLTATAELPPTSLIVTSIANVPGLA